MTHQAPALPRLRPVRLGEGRATIEHRPDGSMIMRCPEPLAPHADFLTDSLEHYAATQPGAVLLTQAQADGTRRALTYGEALRAVRAIGQALLQRGLSVAYPLAILSDNSIECALMTLAAQYAGIPVAPVSPAYALLSRDYARLRQVIEAVQPGLVFAAHAGFAAGLRATVAPHTEIVLLDGQLDDRATTRFADLLATAPGADLDRACAARQPDGVAKLLFTSGSTGAPKGVINTHRMLAANQQMMRQVFAFLQDEPPVMVDWLPWHHTFGGNHNFGIALYNGGTLHIDDGRPTPAGMAACIATLRQIAPTLYFNVPRGYDMLLAELQRDAALAGHFFSRVNLLYYAGAALSPPTWRGLSELALRQCGHRILMLTGLGSTETGPFALASVRDTDRPGEIGVPAPGNELKLVPNGSKLELRLKSPSITPGYWQRPDLTQAAFDQDGYYCIGDAVKFCDPADPSRGLLFDGRVGDDFKLTTGVWVNVATLRARVLTAMAPLVQDAVIVGHDRDEVGVLVIPNPTACRAQFGHEAITAADPALEAWLLERLQSMGGAGSSERVTKLGVLRQALSLDGGEVTDKGSINFRRVIESRASVIEGMYKGGQISWEE